MPNVPQYSGNWKIIFFNHNLSIGMLSANAVNKKFNYIQKDFISHKIVLIWFPYRS